MIHNPNVKVEYEPSRTLSKDITLEKALEEFVKAYHIGTSNDCTKLKVWHVGGTGGDTIVGIFPCNGTIECVFPDHDAPRKYAENIRFRSVEGDGKIFFESQKVEYRIDFKRD